MSAVGFDLFAQMLSQAVAATREGDVSGADALPPALSDITVNVPGHTYLPEEYVPDTDERVLWYRRIASAATVEAVDDLRAMLEAAHPGMPPAASNLLEKARVKAFASEHKIKTVSVTGGRLVVEPIDVPRSKMTLLRRAGGRYVADKRKLQLPLRYFKLEESDNLLGPVTRFLAELLGKGSDDGDGQGLDASDAARATGATGSQGARGSAACAGAPRAAGDGTRERSDASRQRAGGTAVRQSERARDAASSRSARKGRVAERGEAARASLAEKRARRAARRAGKE